jgi:hypothetical protein
MRDGHKALRREMRESGEWENRVMDRRTGSELVMKVKERVLVESCAEGRAKGREYRMPVVDASRGMVVGYIRDGEPAIGCVTRVDESGIWVVRESRSRGRRNGCERIKVVFNGSCEAREEIGKKWRALDLETEAEECRARACVADVRDRDLEVRVISSAEHCECKTLVTQTMW